MINQCPRCGTPRYGDYPVCGACGLDYRVLAQSGWQPPQTPVPPASVVAPPPPAWSPAQYVPPAPVAPAPVAPAPVAPVPPAPVAPAVPAPNTFAVDVTVGGGTAPAEGAVPVEGVTQAAVPQPQPQAPMVCPRCHNQLYPGYPRCLACGLEVPKWAMGGHAPGGRSVLPILLAVIGVALLAAAGLALVLVLPGASAKASPTPQVTPSPVITAAPTIAVPTLSLVPIVETTTAPGTLEPSPDHVWYPFTPPDHTWTVSFPTSAAPTKDTSQSGSGSFATTVTMYLASEGMAVYEVGYATYTGSLSDTAKEFVLDMVADELTSSGTATVQDVQTVTFLGNSAREERFTASGMNATALIWFVGNKLYMLMAVGLPGADVYPEHFFSTFKLH